MFPYPSIRLVVPLVVVGFASAGFDPQAFLATNGPSQPHEGFPHGVPTSYSWYGKSSRPTLFPPHGETLANAWGQAYFEKDFDETKLADVHTRVEIGTSSLWVLYDDSTRWTRIQSSKTIGGGSWAEDFHSTCGALKTRATADGWTSVGIDSAGCNAHFWPNVAHAPVRVGHVRGFLTTTAVRWAPDPVGSTPTAYATQLLVGVGIDWRVPGGGCPIPPESTVGICQGAGIGRFIRLQPAWRLAAYISLTESQLDSVVLPPLEAFALPDGSYPNAGLEGVAAKPHVRGSHLGGGLRLGPGARSVIVTTTPAWIDAAGRTVPNPHSNAPRTPLTSPQSQTRSTKPESR